jgi:hypothetical protein
VEPNQWYNLDWVLDKFVSCVDVFKGAKVKTDIENKQYLNMFNEKSRQLLTDYKGIGILSDPNDVVSVIVGGSRLRVGYVSKWEIFIGNKLYGKLFAKIIKGDRYEEY